MAKVKISQLTANAAKIASTDRVAIAKDDGGGTFSSKYVTGAEINEVKLDTTPQLGGNLDVNGNKITSASNGNISIEPNGTGAVVIGGNSTQATELRFMEDSDNGTNYVALKANNTLAANTTYTLPTADGTSGQVLSTNGTGTLSWATAGGITVGTTAVTSGTDGRVFFQAGGVVQQDGAFNWDNTNKRLGIGANATSPSAALFLRTNTLVANDIFTIQNGQYGNGIFRVRDNVTASQSTIGSIFIQARIYGSGSTITGNELDLGGYGLGSSYGENGSNAVWLNNQGNVGDGAGTSVISVSSNFYVNLQTTKKYKFEAVTGNFGIGNVGSLGARLDVRAQGALSTDIAFRVRNSADTFNLLSIDGVGLISGRTDGAGGFSMNYQGTANTTVQLGFQNTNPYLRVANSNAGGHAFNVYTSSDNREYLAGLIGKATLAIGANPLGGTIKPNEANTNTLYMFNGTAPTLSATDSFNLYSADIVAGNAAPHFRTENGNIIKLYRETTAVTSATVVHNAGGTAIKTDDTFDGYTLSQIVKALRNTGLLA